MTLYETIPRWVKEISNHFTTQEMYNKVVRINPVVFFDIPNCFKISIDVSQAVEEDPSDLRYVSDLFKS